MINEQQRELSPAEADAFVRRPLGRDESGEGTTITFGEEAAIFALMIERLPKDLPIRECNATCKLTAERFRHRLGLDAIQTAIHRREQAGKPIGLIDTSFEGGETFFPCGPQATSNF